MPDTLKTYTVLFARDIPHYASHEIQAESDEAALAAARALHDTDTLAFTDPPGMILCAAASFISNAGRHRKLHDINFDQFRLVGPTGRRLSMPRKNYCWA